MRPPAPSCPRAAGCPPPARSTGAGSRSRTTSGRRGPAGPRAPERRRAPGRSRARGPPPGAAARTLRRPRPGRPAPRTRRPPGRHEAGRVRTLPVRTAAAAAVSLRSREVTRGRSAPPGRRSPRSRLTSTTDSRGRKPSRDGSAAAISPGSEIRTSNRSDGRSSGGSERRGSMRRPWPPGAGRGAANRDLWTAGPAVDADARPGAQIWYWRALRAASHGRTCSATTARCTGSCAYR